VEKTVIALDTYDVVTRIFCEIWENNTEDYIRHLCRKMILRVVLECMQNNIGLQNLVPVEGFFDRLMARQCDSESGKNNYAQKSSYARRMLTFLDNMEKLGYSQNTTFSVSFPVLVKEVLHKPVYNLENARSNVVINDPKIRDLATIISVASEDALIETSGTELVAVNLGDCDSRQPLSKIINEQWDSYRANKCDNNVEFNISITPAGSILAMVFNCFEFFSCRYQPQSTPILVVKTENERKKILLGYKDESTDVMVKGIVGRAVLCVENLVKNETRFLSLNKEQNELYYPMWIYKEFVADKGMVHPIRVLYEHINYLLSLRRFLVKKAEEPENPYDSIQYANNAIDDATSLENRSVDAAITKYRQVLKSISSKNKEYVELGEYPTAQSHPNIFI
jgi:hypothetical protein